MTRVLTVLVMLSLGQAFSDDNKPSLESFSQDVGEEFLEAEQVLSTRVPNQNNPRQSWGHFFPSFRGDQVVPDLYRPSSRQVFEVPTVLIPLDTLPKWLVAQSSDKKEPFFESDYLRFFIHPDSAPYFKEELGKFEKDSVIWYGTPTSSNRTLLVKNADGLSPSFMIKPSLYRKSLAHLRTISDNASVRAVVISKLIDEIHKETGGALPSGKTWDFFPEPTSALPPGRTEGATIGRLIPENLLSKTSTALLLSSLVVPRESGLSWLDELYQASSYSSQKEFVWKEIVEPFVELHSLLSVHNGITTEFHSQNAMLRIDPTTKKILGPVFRDMDGSALGQPYRKNFLGKEAPSVPEYVQKSQALSYEIARERQVIGYFTLRNWSIEYLFRGFLSPEEIQWVLNRADQKFISDVNETYPDRKMKNITQIKDWWKKVHQDSMTEEFQGLPARKRFPTERLMALNTDVTLYKLRARQLCTTLLGAMSSGK